MGTASAGDKKRGNSDYGASEGHQKSEARQAQNGREDQTRLTHSERCRSTCWFGQAGSAKARAERDALASKLLLIKTYEKDVVCQVWSNSPKTPEPPFKPRPIATLALRS